MPENESVARRLPPIMVAVPCGEWMYTLSVTALLAMNTRGLPGGSAFSFYRNVSTPALARNVLVEGFLERPEYEALLFIDADMTPPADVAEQLLAHDVDVVGGLYFQRHPPHREVFGALAGEPLTLPGRGLREVEWVGGGCLLIRRHVLEAIPYPWFEHPVPGMDEDVVFCRKVRAGGERVYLDLSCRVGHVSPRAVDEPEALQILTSPRGQQLLAAPMTSARAAQANHAATAAMLARASNGVVIR